jgi:adenylate cyclase
MASRLSLFLAELKRRKVYQVAAVYAAVGVAISIAVPDLFGAFGFPSWSAPLVIVVILLGFPIAIILAWAYEVKPEEPRGEQPGGADETPGRSGLKRRKPEAATETPLAGGIHETADDRPFLVVLPFENLSDDPENEYFSDGVTEDIMAHLAGVRGLRLSSFPRNGTSTCGPARMTGAWRTCSPSRATWLGTSCPLSKPSSLPGREWLSAANPPRTWRPTN